MRRIAVRIAVVGFFVLAAVGWACGRSPLTCATRAVIGAVILFVLTRISVRVLTAALADAMVDGASNVKRKEGGE
mgnify:CR=1 FL=1